MTTKYGSIRRGKVKFKIGSKLDKYLHTKKISHSHVTKKNGKKTYKRYYA